MRILMTPIPFQVNSEENIIVEDQGNEYQVEVLIGKSDGLPDLDIEISILERGVSTEKEEEIKEFIRQEIIQKYQIDRKYE